MSRIVARHPELFLSNTDSKYTRHVTGPFDPGPGPARFGNLPEVHETGAWDDGDPADPEGGRTAAVVARLQKEHPGYFSPSQAYGANTSIPPKSPAARAAAQAREHGR